MRVIKFRLWSKVAQCMIPWEDVKQKPHTIFDQSRWEPMQFTGLKDKNGEDIYEGDIVSSNAYYNEGFRVFNYQEREEFTIADLKGGFENSFTSEVKYEEGGFFLVEGDCEAYLSMYFGDMRHTQPIFELEVIGNIHENPELLK